MHEYRLDIARGELDADIKAVMNTLATMGDEKFSEEKINLLFLCAQHLQSDEELEKEIAGFAPAPPRKALSQGTAA